ncbi:hypothetical protein ATCC90586_010249 [Pythium insidiosum]|nr:hypothetical protein ATCC90586_010249 [Pythium insidiosum]
MASSTSMRRRSSAGMITASTAGLVAHTFEFAAEKRRVAGKLSGSQGWTTEPPGQRDPPVDLLTTLIDSSPGCYPWDDGSADIKERYNFCAHSKRFLFAPLSLGLFPESSRFRQTVVWCITSKRFDQFILFLIFANSIILAIADYSKVNAEGDLDSTQSYRNAVVNYADSIFTTLFTVECSMKIIAMGMFGEKGAYLMDPWNVLDFAVVFVGTDMMYTLQDAGFNAIAVIYFVSFIIFGSYFMLNLTLAVIWENFSESSFQEAEERKKQRKIQHHHGHNQSNSINDGIAASSLRRCVNRVITHKLFEWLRTALILLNTVILSLDQYPSDEKVENAVEVISFCLTLAFAVECMLKVTALGWRKWGKDGYNVFDALVVLLGIVEILLSPPAFFPGEQFESREVGNFSVLFLLFMYIYALIGMQTFANQFQFDVHGYRATRPDDIYYIPRSNFDTLLWSLVTVFQLLNVIMVCLLVFFIFSILAVNNLKGKLYSCQGERWNDMMYELATQTDCTPDPDYDPRVCGFNNTQGCIDLNGCGSPVAFIYMYSFTLIVSFILLNIFIAVILEGFSNEKDRAEGVLLPQHYENFVTTWSMFDPEATGFIEWHLLPRFLEALAPPLGFDPSNKPSRKQIEHFAHGLDLPIFRGTKVFFNDVGRRMGKIIIDETSDEPLRALPAIMNMEQRWRKYLASRNVKKQDFTMFRVNQFHAGVVLHTAVKSLILQSDLKEKVRKFTQRMAASRALPSLPIESSNDNGEDDVDKLMRLVEAENEGLDI